MKHPALIQEALNDPSLIQSLRADPLMFSRLMFGIRPTSYQKELLTSKSNRILIRWPRQSGKTRTLAQLSIWRACTAKDHTTLIIAPSERQSIICRDQIQKLLGYMPSTVRKGLVRKTLRTRIYFRNGSRVLALPNNEETIRGHRAHMVILDEAAFFGNDETILRHVVVPMLATTGGTLILSSTPWGKNSAFYRLSQDPAYTQLHIDWRTPMAEGVYHPSFKHEIEATRASNPLAYQTEFMAEFAEEADTWLTQEILTNAIDPSLEYRPYNDKTRGSFYAGIDLAERVDHTAIAVIERDNGYRLVHLKQFPLRESLTSVIGYTKVLSLNWNRLHLTHIDHTKHGDHIVNDFNNATPSAGVTFTHRSKMHMAQQLKTRLTDGSLTIPYHRETLDELNTVTYHLTKGGTIQYDHPRGTHDDMFWAIALALNAAEENPPASRPMAKVV